VSHGRELKKSMTNTENTQTDGTPPVALQRACSASPPELVEALKEINRHIEYLEAMDRLGVSGSIVTAWKQRDRITAALCEATPNISS
jgi:hypothetical protein